MDNIISFTGASKRYKISRVLLYYYAKKNKINVMKMGDKNFILINNNFFNAVGLRRKKLTKCKKNKKTLDKIQ